MSIDLQPIVDYFTDLLIIQYKEQPKAKAMVQMAIRALLCKGVMFDIRGGFDVKSAIGKQLDIIGKYVGVNRFFTGTVLNPAKYFGYSGSAGIGYGKGLYFSYKTNPVNGNTLDDDSFRILINLKIAINGSNGSMYELDSILYSFFGSDIYISSGNKMDITYFVKKKYSLISLVAVQKNLLPAPAGMAVMRILRRHDLPFFGYSGSTGGVGYGKSRYLSYADVIQ